MSVYVLIPFWTPLDGDEHREAALGFVRRWYAEHHPGWQGRHSVIVSDSPPSKGAAIASILDLNELDPDDVLVLADADSWVNEARLLEAVAAIEAGATWSTPHTHVSRYSRATSEIVTSGGQPKRWGIERQPYRGVIGGGIVCVQTSVYVDVGGIDPRFEGWGGEDEAFGLALSTLHGPPVQLDGTLHHLWHRHAAERPRSRPASEISRELIERYRAAAGDPEAMRQVLARD